MHSLDQADRQSAKRHVFHIAHVEGVVRGSRVTYLGQRFAVIEVSESNKLLGLELQCEPDARGG